ncbi:MAG: hypothetical protein N3D84_02870 [Candidatus Woesearchaeota archaeon]|nr:hypothetical protein [Candidatus Woesearchaeota archaeon]
MDINATIPIIEPLASPIKNFMNTISVLVGGLFGLYLINLLWNIYRFNSNKRMIKKLIKNIEKLNRSMSRLERRISALEKKEKR